MAVTYGFYNALNHDRLYDAIQMSSIFDGIIQDGIFSTIGTSMIVTAPEDGMFVDVGPGRAWFNHTWTLNDTELPVEAEAAEVVLDRIDAVILEVNSAAEVRANSIKFLKGTPSSNPVKPTLTHNAEVNQYALAYVTIRAGQTTIFQSDIENVVGTDETPFVTGLLQQLSIERLLLQWDDEFHRYFANFKRVSEADLNTWFNARKDEYDAWYADMELEGATDLATFDAWFQHMKDQLDEDAAGHLQAEIDDLAEQCEKGSIVTVTTEEASLIGRSCTISQGLNSVVKTFDSNGVAYFPSIPYVGNDIDVRATNGDNIAQGTLTIPYFGRYGIEIDFWAATLDIHSTVEALYGRTLTISKGGSTVGTTTFDNTGHATFKVHETGTYHISTSTAGGDVYETDVTVTEETVYPISLGLPNGQTVTPVNDIQTWLKCAGITDKAYLTTLADVLNEPATYETLLSDSNACDYLARSTEFSGLGSGLVPVMTSDTTPSGVVIKSSVLGGEYSSAWKVFDGTNTSREDSWISQRPMVSPEWIGYQFTSAVVVKAVRYVTRNTVASGDPSGSPHTMTLQGSNDGTNWTDIGSYESSVYAGNAEVIFSVQNSTAYSYYRLSISSVNTGDGSNYASLGQLQFHLNPKGITDDATAMATLGKYDYACEKLLTNATWASAICNSAYMESVLDKKVPTMTSATTPSGRVSSNGDLSGYPAYYAFDSSSSSVWFGNASLPLWIRYQFTEPVKVIKFDVANRSDNNTQGMKKAKLQYSDDGSTFYDASSVETFEPYHPTSNTKIANYTEGAHEYWRMLISETLSGGCGVSNIQFYGRHEAQTGIIHSAPVDTIYYISAGQQVPVCVTDADGVGHFDLDDLPKGSLTLYSTVAKDPDNLSNNYSKQFTITSNTTEIWLMPDGALYWWGWVSNLIESCSTANGWSDNAYRAPVYNTNNCYCQANSGNAFSGIGSKNKIAVSKLHFIGLRSNYSYPGYFGLMDTKKLANMRQSADPGTSLSHTQITNSGTSPCYVGVSANNNDPARTITASALWVE